MLRSVAFRYWVAIALSLAWLMGATVLLCHQRAVEVGRQSRQCHQLQDDARSNKLCADANTPSDQPLCRFKDADCDQWPLEEAAYAKKIASLAILPVVLAWVIFYGFVKIIPGRSEL